MKRPVRLSLALVAVFLLLVTTANGQYRDGDVRLVGGSYQWEGRVEVYMSGVWGTITDSDWTNDDAVVVCRKLGHFRPGATGHSNAYFGEGKGPVSVDSVICSGSEYSLTDCELQNSGLTTSHSLDVGVKCQPAYESYREGDIRLVGGPHNWEGRVEILWMGQWGAISDSSWTSNDARVVCRQLQHAVGSGIQVACCGQYGSGSGSVLIRNVRCYGSEGNITTCRYNNATVQIGPRLDVGVRCRQGNKARDGEIRLNRTRGTTGLWNGRVEVFLSGEWGTVCDDGTYSNVAQVVCRQLGYYVEASSYRCCARYGYGTGPIHFTGAQCLGSEHRLVDCRNQSYTCYHGEDWSVECQIDGPEELDIRLSSNSYSTGYVQLFTSGSWVPVANTLSTWTVRNSNVVCRQLGYNPEGSITSISNSYFNYNYTTMDNVVCSGTEAQLTNCHYDFHHTYISWIYVHFRCTYYSCTNGAIRLVGGDSDREGRVEVCSRNRWGTVCDKTWTMNHTLVVCRYLGFSDLLVDLSRYSSERYGKGSGPVLMDFVNCTGTENSLTHCHYFTHYFGCSHDNDVGIRCGPVRCSRGQLRLTKSSQEYYGRVEICFNHRWNTFSYNNWQWQNAFVACKELGFRGYSHWYSIQNDGLSRYSNYYRCTSAELTLSVCRNYTETGTTSSQSCGITCRRDYCSDGELRLMDGEDEWEGRLEVCYNGRWGAVGANGWTETNSHVVCNALGYDITNEPANQSIPMAPSKPLYYHSIRCSIRDLSLLECGFKRFTEKTKIFPQAIIKCKEPECNDGELRLVGGLSQSEGRLEVCFNKRWGTIDGDGWTHTDTKVACSQLELPVTDVLYDKSERRRYGGSLSLPVFMTFVGCYGNEKNLTHCSYHKSDYSTSISTEYTSMDVSISCQSKEGPTGSPTGNGNETDKPAGGQSIHQHSNDNNSMATAAISVTALFAVVVVILVAIILVLVVMVKKKKTTAEREVPSEGDDEDDDDKDTNMIGGRYTSGIKYNSSTQAVSLENRHQVNQATTQTFKNVENPENPTPNPFTVFKKPTLKKAPVLPKPSALNPIRGGRPLPPPNTTTVIPPQHGYRNIQIQEPSNPSEEDIYEIPT